MDRLLRYRTLAYWFSGILTALSVLALAVWGLPLGLDFKGGTLMEVRFAAAPPSADALRGELDTLGLQSLSVQPTGERGAIIRYLASDEGANERVLESLKKLDPAVAQERVDFIGASVSAQIKQNAFQAVAVALIVIACYIAYAFRRVSRPITSWQYGTLAVVALFHDVVVTLGIFAVLARFFELEVNATFIAALLTILGFSVHDTIVVYDRIRENLIRARGETDFETIVNRSLEETLARSLNTSFTTLFVLAALLVYGGESIRSFVVTLLVGIAAGTYSSFYVASALLVSLHEYRQKKAHG